MELIGHDFKVKSKMFDYPLTVHVIKEYDKSVVAEIVDYDEQDKGRVLDKNSKIVVSIKALEEIVA
ncbi:MAG: DUF2187 domain-containing protein [Streptococcaceae bacterium]|jgi:predicted RNA-binding protein YlqC (UPF0109 family)|nr:DUF2187 domain-containing protein [Streptococcaceae bacterium]